MKKKLFLTEPYLLTLHPATEMNIVWIQREPLQGLVEFGKTEELGQCIEAECFEVTGLRKPATEEGYTDIPEDNPLMPVWQCIAKIEGLIPGERIYYRCRSGEVCTQLYHFRTAPEPGQPYCFAQLSDLQGIPSCDESVYCIGCNSLDFLLYSGDTCHIGWHVDQWFDMEESWQSREKAKRAFFPCMQQQNGAHLMQYIPTFICPGNHEVTDFRHGVYKDFAADDTKWDWSIYMQLFRPLYPEMDTTRKGKRWYSVDYSDMHIVSLSISRWARWSAYEYPGWRLSDSIAPDSPQICWLKEDLKSKKGKFTWVIQHFHILNKGVDVQMHLCDPVPAENGMVTYPSNDGGMLMELFENSGVNGVSFGHSHVYERYYYKGVHYIEAAYLSYCYREQNAPIHPLGIQPVVEDNSRRSFLFVERKDGGLFAKGYYIARVPELFDVYQIADEMGESVPPVKIAGDRIGDDK